MILVSFFFNYLVINISAKSPLEYPGQCYPIHVRVGKKKKYDIFALQPGEEVNDPNTCGTTVCMNAEGLTYVY